MWKGLHKDVYSFQSVQYIIPDLIPLSKRVTTLCSLNGYQTARKGKSLDTTYCCQKLLKLFLLHLQFSTSGPHDIMYILSHKPSSLLGLEGTERKIASNYSQKGRPQGAVRWFSVLTIYIHSYIIDKKKTKCFPGWI
jgi:hypothetical protein